MIHSRCNDMTPVTKNNIIFQKYDSNYRGIQLVRNIFVT